MPLLSQTPVVSWGQVTECWRLVLAPLRDHAILTIVRVIARGTLNDFVQNRVERKLQKAVKDQLDSWYAEAAKATWKSPAEVKTQYRSASIVSSEHVVFNIKGNDYRLIVAISYHYQVLLIKWLGTHKEYDQIDAEKVEYEKQRYANPSN